MKNKSRAALASLLVAIDGGGRDNHAKRGFGPNIAFAFVSPKPTRHPRGGNNQRVIGRLSFNGKTDSTKEGGGASSSSSSSSNISNEKKAKDFPAWVKALTRWDTIPEQQSQSSPTSASDVVPKEEISFGSSFSPFRRQSSSSSIWDDEMSPLVASLSGMVNVEALMVAAANETDEAMDSLALLPDIDDLKRKTIGTTETTNEEDAQRGEEASSTTKLFPFLDNALKWEDFVPQLQKNIQELTDLIPDDNNSGLNVTFEELVNMVPNDGEQQQQLLSDNGLVVDAEDQYESPTTSSYIDTADATEKILQDASQRLELLINGTSDAFSPTVFQSLILRASKALTIQEASGNLTAAAYNIFEKAGKAPRATAEYTADLVQFANGVLADGYAPLFAGYPSVKRVDAADRRRKIIKPAEFASLAGAVYEDDIPKTTGLGHSIVAQGKTADIGWMVTDSLQYERDFRSDDEVRNENEQPALVRTFVLRGYDASDEEVDREDLLNVICTASPVPLFEDETSSVRVHEGMLSIARELMRELEKYIDMTSPSHKIAFTGHSIGGSLAILMMILLANERGAGFVRDNVLRVFTFGSPPIFEIETTSSNLKIIEGDSCSILDAFDLPTDIVYGYCQPWDPIVRLYSKYDPLYPLIDDLGEDGYTPWVSGPTRTLRPILKTILESWEGWPDYRDNARVKLGQDYRGVGEHFLLLPEPIRYLTDRLVSVNIAVPDIDDIVQISSNDLLPALNEVFTVDVFRISYVSVAIRSFVHHFYPAYGSPVVDYAQKISEEEE